MNTEVDLEGKETKKAWLRRKVAQALLPGSGLDPVVADIAPWIMNQVPAHLNLDFLYSGVRDPVSSMLTLLLPIGITDNDGKVQRKTYEQTTFEDIKQYISEQLVRIKADSVALRESVDVWLKANPEVAAQYTATQLITEVRKAA